ncbi:MAG: hypothetical protein MUO19_03955 [Dehalococcoidales bacterium]|nr:hypothetical protein [Dehalococcoidales bacterium]
MLRKLALTAQPLPLSLRLTDVKTYGIITAFVALSVLTPWAFHQFSLAGATFLPMHFFVIIAALTCGWQAGLIVGLATPLASYAITGMPAATILPQLTVEIMAYGLLAGLLRQKFNLNVGWSLLGAMVGGRLALLLAVVVIQAITGNVYSPLGPAAGSFTAVWHTVSQSWPGLVALLTVIPAAMWLIGRARKQES